MRDESPEVPRAVDGDDARSDARRAGLIRLLCDVAGLCGRGGSLRSIVDESVRRVCEFNGFDTGRVYLLAADDRSRLELVSEHRSDAARRRRPGGRPADERERAGRGGDETPGHPFAEEDSAESAEPVASARSEPHEHREHAVVMPIRVDGAVVGALQLFGPNRPDLPESERAAIESVGIQIGRVAERRRLEWTVRLAAASERTRLVQQLHDTTCQELAAICLSAGRLERRMNTGRDADLASVEAIAAGSRHALEGLRAAIGGLVPPGLQQGSIAMALEHLASRVRTMHGISCTSSCDVEVPQDHCAAELFCIASEAASNAARHARARRIHVDLRATAPDVAVLEVQDDGVGMRPGDAPGLGLGLSLMRHRASALGGRFSISSSPGRGTTVRCEVPNHADHSQGHQGDADHDHRRAEHDGCTR